MANHHKQLNTNAKKTQGVADKRSLKRAKTKTGLKKEKRKVLEWGKAKSGSKKSKAGFRVVFCITGGVLGIRCNLEGSSFEPPGSLYIYMTVSRDS